MDRSSRPHTSPTWLPGWRVKRIRRLRKRRWTGAKIARVFANLRSTGSLWLWRLGMGRLRDLDAKEKPVRYERSRPGELLHLDTKKLGRIGCAGHQIHGDRRRSSPGVGWEYLHVCVDDAITPRPETSRRSAGSTSSCEHVLSNYSWLVCSRIRICEQYEPPNLPATPPTSPTGPKSRTARGQPIVSSGPRRPLRSAAESAGCG